jgi:hypothetical protein
VFQLFDLEAAAFEKPQKTPLVVAALVLGGAVKGSEQPPVRGHEKKEPPARPQHVACTHQGVRVVSDMLEHVQTQHRVRLPPNPLTGQSRGVAGYDAHVVDGFESSLQELDEVGIGLERDDLVGREGSKLREGSESGADVDDVPAERVPCAVEQPSVVARGLVGELT